MRSIRQRTCAAALVTVVLTMAACTSGGDDSAATSIVPLPGGGVGSRTSAATHSSRHGTKISGNPSATRSSSGGASSAASSAKSRPGGHCCATSRPPTSSAPHTSSAPPAHPTVTVTPHSGLTNGQQVHVVGTGFTPGLRLVVIECFDLGEATGPRDCDLSQLKYVNASGMGRVDTMLTVHKSIGFPARTCGAPTPCLVSVSVPSQTNHYEMGNQRITFG